MSDAIVRLVTNLPRRTALTPDAPGETIRIRILRECGRWCAGQTGVINADYGRALIESGLAEVPSTKNLVRRAS